MKLLIIAVAFIIQCAHCFDDSIKECWDIRLQNPNLFCYAGNLISWPLSKNVYYDQDARDASKFIFHFIFPQLPKPIIILWGTNGRVPKTWRHQITIVSLLPGTFTVLKLFQLVKMLIIKRWAFVVTFVVCGRFAVLMKTNPHVTPKLKMLCALVLLI